jgi:hypothetical protein
VNLAPPVGGTFFAEVAKLCPFKETASAIPWDFVSYSLIPWDFINHFLISYSLEGRASPWSAILRFFFFAFFPLRFYRNLAIVL